MGKQIKKKPTKALAVKAEVEFPVVPDKVITVHRSDPDSMLAIAVEKGMDLNYVEKLMDLRDREIARVAKMEYLAAMTKFQEMAPDMLKNRKVDYTTKGENSTTVKYNFQDLGNIISLIRKPLSECGLSYRWEQIEQNGKIIVTCIVSHVGGHVERGMPLDGDADKSGNKQGLHAKASTITYLQRYTLKGILGLASTETDDDGQRGNGTGTPSTLKPLKPNQLEPTLAKVRSGEWTLDMIEKNCILSPEYRAKIEEAELEAKKFK